ESRKVRLSGAAAASFHDDSTPGGSGTAAMNRPVAASCTAGGTGVRSAVVDPSGKRTTAVLAVTKNRGGPAAASGAPVAIGAARDDARSGGDGVGEGFAGGPGLGVIDPDGGARMASRPAAGSSPQPATCVSTRSTARAAARGDMRRS